MPHFDISFIIIIILSWAETMRYTSKLSIQYLSFACHTVPYRTVVNEIQNGQDSCSCNVALCTVDNNPACKQCSMSYPLDFTDVYGSPMSNTPPQKQPSSFYRSFAIHPPRFSVNSGLPFLIAMPFLHW